VKSSTETLITALRVLARDIESPDGIANAAISEAADRMEHQYRHIKCALKLLKHMEKTKDLKMNKISDRLLRVLIVGYTGFAK
jgi:hypothetical protein